MTQLDDILARAEAAKFNWCKGDVTPAGGRLITVAPDEHGIIHNDMLIEVLTVDLELREALTDFIVHARTDVVRMGEVIRKLRYNMIAMMRAVDHTLLDKRRTDEAVGRIDEQIDTILRGDAEHE